MQQYPKSAYAAVVADPAYFKKMQQAEAEADSLYERTYRAYRQGEYQQVKAELATADSLYPLSSLMPRFLFLDAVATAKTDGQEAFGDKLIAMVNRYPQGPLTAMAKDMLGMMNRGMEAQQGDDQASTLEDKRQAQADSLAAAVAEEELPEDRHIVVITLPQSEAQVNRLLYEVALYNF